MNRYGYAMVEGAGGGPSVFQAGLKNVFDCAAGAYDLVPFAKWMRHCRESPSKTVAYVTSTDPFTQPSYVAEKIIKGPALRPCTTRLPGRGDRLHAVADAVAATKPKSSFSVRLTCRRSPPSCRPLSRPTTTRRPSSLRPVRTRAAFTKAVGLSNADGMMVPNAWFGGSKNPESEKMVAEYIKKYGGTASDVNADVAEAYSVGQVITAAVKATGGFDNSKIISYLHSGVTIQSVLGAREIQLARREHQAHSFYFPVAGIELR